MGGQHGIPVDDQYGDLLPHVADAITRTVTAAIWFGLTTWYLTLTCSYHIPVPTVARTMNKAEPAFADASSRAAGVAKITNACSMK